LARGEEPLEGRGEFPDLGEFIELNLGELTEFDEILGEMREFEVIRELDNKRVFIWISEGIGGVEG
jgi:hypothetical protein